MKSVQQEVEERGRLAGTNKFELLLFRLGQDERGQRSELFGINIFKIREIVPMPAITAVAGAPLHVLGVVNLRGQIIQVLDLPSITGCKPQTGLNIMLVTEFARTTQAFAVESWDQLNAIAASAEAEGKTVYDKVAMVVTDLEMPEMDGFTLTRNVKKSGRFANLPVVIHSSLSDTTNEENVRSVGADGYVAKFSPEDLAGTIRRVLHR